jgi:branched-chain amino acid transport system substrate-binding protein
MNIRKTRQVNQRRVAPHFLGLMAAWRPARLAALALAILGTVESVVAADSAAAAAPGAPGATALKIGLMLPYSGTYASLGTAIENGFQLFVKQQGGRLAGRPIVYSRVDDESEPSKAVANVGRLIDRDRVDVLVGTVHSGVAMAMAKATRESGTLMIVPNAGANALTRAQCAPNVFRTSFSNWQPAFAMGSVAAELGMRRAVTITWKYAAGDESAAGFREGFEHGGGQVLKDLALPFPNVEFQALLTEIASLKPDVVYAFFSGGGAVKFVKDYAAAGLARSAPLVGPGFLTDGTLDGQGEAAQGIMTTLHYADDLGTPRDAAFRADYQKAYGMPPDVFAVQGYDAAQLLAAGLAAVKGDVTQRDALRLALEAARIDSPRGPFVMSHAHNPIQDIYLRKVVGLQNKVQKTVIRQLEDPGTGCKL